MGYTINPNKRYIMPANFGPWPPMDSGHYAQITQLSISYVTDKDRLAALLPKPIEPAEIPVVNYTLQVCRGCDFLAGRGYNLISVNLSAVFKGKKDYVEGAYAAVLWESDTYPIILGREHFGAPKIYGQIPDPSFDRDVWSFSCSEYGNKLLDAEVKNLKPLTAADCKRLSEDGTKGNWICWHYLPGPGGNGIELNYATVVKSIPEYHKAWYGDGKITLHSVNFSQAPVSHHIIKGLKSLPVKQYLPAMMSEISNELLLKPTRKLI